MFRDRLDAGRSLADIVTPAAPAAPVVVGLPRGGVIVASAVAEALGAPLDALGVTKVGAPGHPELAAGAVAEGEIEFVNDVVVMRHRIPAITLAAAFEEARRRLTERMREIRAQVPLLDIEGRNVIVVDDGLATGSTARAALIAARRRGALRVVLAVPVGSPQTVLAMSHHCDDVIALEQPEHLRAVGLWYRDFSQTETDEAIGALIRHRP
jgi:putative phosphoribosyl transferase